MCTINDNCIQRRLLADPNWTFKKALELAVALESAECDAADLPLKLQQNQVFRSMQLKRKGARLANVSRVHIIAVEGSIRKKAANSKKQNASIAGGQDTKPKPVGKLNRSE